MVENQSVIELDVKTAISKKLVDDVTEIDNFHQMKDWYLFFHENNIESTAIINPFLDIPNVCWVVYEKALKSTKFLSTHEGCTMEQIEGLKKYFNLILDIQGIMSKAVLRSDRVFQKRFLLTGEFIVSDKTGFSYTGTYLQKYLCERNGLNANDIEDSNLSNLGKRTEMEHLQVMCSTWNSKKAIKYGQPYYWHLKNCHLG